MPTALVLDGNNEDMVFSNPVLDYGSNLKGIANHPTNVSKVVSNVVKIGIIRVKKASV